MLMNIDDMSKIVAGSECLLVEWNAAVQSIYANSNSYKMSQMTGYCVSLHVDLTDMILSVAFEHHRDDELDPFNYDVVINENTVCGEVINLLTGAVREALKRLEISENKQQEAIRAMQKEQQDRRYAQYMQLKSEFEPSPSTKS